MRKPVFALLGMLLCLSANAAVKQGNIPPDNLGINLDGQLLNLAPLRGKVVVISFWATWCAYCMQELPVLAGLQMAATEHHLPLQVVSVDYKEDHATFAHAVRLLKPRLPGMLMSWDEDGTIGLPYGTNKGIPVMVMLHRDGTVAHIHAGYEEKDLDGIVAEINALLADPAALPAAPHAN